MTTLDNYLRTSHKDDGAFLGRLQTRMHEVLPIFYRRSRRLPVPHSKEQIATWPYAVGAGAEDNGEFSASTHCMVLFALDAFTRLGKDRYSLLLGPNFRPGKASGAGVDMSELAKVVETTRSELFDLVRRRKREDPLFTSGTYGKDDPFTLTWLTELAFRAQPERPEKRDREIRASIGSAVRRATTRKQVLDLAGAPGAFNQVTGSFLDLRRLQLLRAGERFLGRRWATPWTDKLWELFDTRIHRQLSYAASADPRADPAELAFAFEGALLLNRNWVAGSMVERVFSALALSPVRLSLWR